ncbi:tetratricopeptide repeat protein [Actimicrobium antarcticum]|uniref:Sel1 repeat family protein n=1 Tax=Actimicrobium antarcticum TaxID=1051899 RepID=A0ABP7SFZ4_9BURK
MANSIGIRSAVLVFALLASHGPLVHADEIDLVEIVRNPVIGNYKGYAEFKMAHYDNARMIWEALAQRGNADASFNLGILSEDGLGEPQSMPEALRHYEQAAEAGSPRAQYRLGLLYSAGVKIPKDDARADRWLTAAAAQGDTDAAARLALRNAAHRTPRDQAFYDAETLHAAGQYSEAAAIFQRLAQAGDTRSQSRLGWMFEVGQGVPRDLDQAAVLFRQAAESGDADAQYALAVMLQTGKGQTRNPEEADAWLHRAAAQGHVLATSALKKGVAR